MKYLLLFAGILVSFSSRASLIDNLKTDDDVRAFLKQTVAADWKVDPLANDKPTFNEKLAKVKWVKLDLNGDGVTDLLVNGRYLWAIIDAGK
jgi:hypothetical protein